MSTPTPTKEQQMILDSPARIRLIRAVPGSGKTWLVADLIKKELAQWQPMHSGIAALSFTRVGGDEIRKAVGYDLHHPHFVGTIDAFLFRFIVRPFLKEVLPELAIPRLIPAEWEPNKWQKGANCTNFTVRVGAGSSAKVFNLFDVCFLGEDKDEPIIACKQRPWHPIAPLDGQAKAAVLKAKRTIWEKHGWLTHSDAAFLASKILGSQSHGPMVRAEVLRRFPLVIIDELQDTGWFLGQCILQLLADLSVRSVLVGDPDQAIYEFNGARPDLFDRFAEPSGTQELPLGRTQRCSPAVCKVAKHLAEPNRCIDPAPDRTGRAFLLSYKSLEEDIRQLHVTLARRSDNGIVKTVARHTKTVEMLTGCAVEESPKLGSVPLNHLHRAVNSLRRRRQVSALAAAQAALEYALFGHEGITNDELAGRGIDSTAWRRVTAEVLLEANSEMTGESFESWGKRMAAFIQNHLTSIVSTGSGTSKIKLPSGDVKCETREAYLIAPTSNFSQERRVVVQTVHAVKGETHDLTVFVCPDTNQANRCPSEIWWADGEERRIAFVAITRTRGDLIVCVSEQCFARLKEKRTSFVGSFECMPIGSFIANN